MLATLRLCGFQAPWPGGIVLELPAAVAAVATSSAITATLPIAASLPGALVPLLPVGQSLLVSQAAGPIQGLGGFSGQKLECLLVGNR